MMQRGTAVSVVLLLFIALPSAYADAGDPVSLRFAWPNYLVLRVDRSFERRDILPSGPSPSPIRSDTRFTWMGIRSNDEYRVLFSGFEVVRPEAPPTSRDALIQLEYVARSVEPLLPTIVVDTSGQPLELGGLSELRAQVLSRYEAIPGIASDPQSKRMLEVLTSEQMLVQRALEDWNRMVQVWHGVVADVGDIKEMNSTTGEAIGSPVENVLSYAIESRVPCTSSDQEQSCVRLVVTQSPRSSDARAAAKMLFGFDFFSALGVPPTADFAVENTFSTDTNPDSLVPTRYVKEKRWSVKWDDASGALQTVGRIDRWVYKFTSIE